MIHDSASSPEKLASLAQNCRSVNLIETNFLLPKIAATSCETRRESAIPCCSQCLKPVEYPMDFFLVAPVKLNCTCFKLVSLRSCQSNVFHKLGGGHEKEKLFWKKVDEFYIGMKIKNQMFGHMSNKI